MAIRTLVAKFVADTGQFKRGVKQAEAALTGFAGKVAAIAGGVLSAQWLSGAISQSVEFGDSLAKVSDRLGLTTQNLQAIRHAGDLAGVSMEGIDLALTQFVRRLGDAQNGSGELAKTFKALGLNAAELASQSPYQSLIQVSDVIQKLPNQAAKAAAAFDLFGKSGVQLLNLLGQSGAGLREASKEVAAFGTALDRTTAAKFEILNDNFFRFKELVRGIKLAIGTEFASVINLGIDNFVKWASEGGRAANFIRLSIQTMAEVGIQAAASFSAAWTIAFESIRAIAAQTIALGARAVEGIGSGIRNLRGLAGGIAAHLGFTGRGIAAIAGPQSPGQTENTARFLAEDLENQVAQSIAKITAAFDDLISRGTANEFRQRFEDMNQEFFRAAQAMAAVATSAIDLEEVLPKEPKAGKTGDFKQISLSRTAIGGLSAQNRQQVMDPQLKETNRLLQLIESRFRTNGATYAP